MKYFFLTVLSLVLLSAGCSNAIIKVQGESMNPTLKSGQEVIIDKNSETIGRGDIVVYKPASETSWTNMRIHRIVGIPGDTVKVQEGKVYINGKILDESRYLSNDSFTQANDSEVNLGTDQFYVLGDNRQKSADSRLFGALNRNDILGKVIIK